MKGAKAWHRPAEVSVREPKVTPGMAALLRGGNGEPSAEQQPAPETRSALATPGRTPGNKRLLQVSLWLADVVLIGLAARLVFQSSGSFGFLEAALCVAAVTVGAWLGCLAFWLE